MERKHLIFIIVTIFALSVSGCGATEIDEKPSVKKEVQKESKTENKKRDEKETEKKVKDSKKAKEEKSVSEEKKSADKNVDNTSTPSSSSKQVSKPATTESSKPAPAPEPSKPAPQPTPQPVPQPEPEPPVVNHYWVPETRQEQVWVEDYEYRTFCSCGADITDCIDMHYADGCDGSYYAKQVPCGGHYETQTVETGRYICSGCGAVK